MVANCVWYGIGLVLWFRSPTASENAFIHDQYHARMALDICNKSIFLSFDLVLYSSRSGASCLFYWNMNLGITSMTQLTAQLATKWFKSQLSRSTRMKGQVSQRCFCFLSIAKIVVRYGPFPFSGGLSPLELQHLEAWVYLVMLPKWIHNRSHPGSLLYPRTIIYYRGVPVSTFTVIIFHHSHNLTRIRCNYCRVIGYWLLHKTKSRYMIWHLLERQQLFLLSTFHRGSTILHPLGGCKWIFFVEINFPSHIFAEKQTRWGLFSTHWIPFTVSLFQSMFILAQTPNLLC